MELTPEKTSKQRLGSINQAEDHKWKKEMVFVVKHSCSWKCDMNKRTEYAPKEWFPSLSLRSSWSVSIKHKRRPWRLKWSPWSKWASISGQAWNIFSLSEPDHTKIHSYNLIELHILFICIGKKSHKILVCILEWEHIPDYKCLLLKK